jgi:hypothetical protein
MDKAQKKRLLTQLSYFYRELIEYRRLTVNYINSLNPHLISSNMQRQEDNDAFQTKRLKLQEIYGGLKSSIEQYGEKPVIIYLYPNKPREEVDASRNAFMKATASQDTLLAIDSFIKATNLAKGRISSEEGEEIGIDSDKDVPSESTKVLAFISHGKDSKALDKLCRFVRELGIEPLVVKDQPSEGKAVDDKVAYYLDQADCAIILATGDDEIDGKLHPRENVAHEIGMAQAKFPNKIIYLLEKGAAFSSNISPKVWESFTKESMDEAFIAILRELKAFGILKVCKPK